MRQAADYLRRLRRVRSAGDLARLAAALWGGGRSLPAVGQHGAAATGNIRGALAGRSAGRRGGSRRGAAPLSRAAVPLSLGCVTALREQVSASLRPAHDETAERVRQAAMNGNETGWKEAGKERRLWAAVTATAALLVTHTSRGRSGRRLCPVSRSRG